MTEIAIIFSVNLVTSIVKRWVYPKWGATGVQAVAFVLALLGALYYTYKNNVPGLEHVVMETLAIFSLSVTLYEVILQHIPVFKGPPVETE